MEEWSWRNGLGITACKLVDMNEYEYEDGLKCWRTTSF